MKPLGWRRIAFTDNVEAAKDFATGDIVRRLSYRGHTMSPFIGRVLYSNVQTGTVTVQWPWGVEQESPTELLVDLQPDHAPPMALDQIYSTWESTRYINDKATQKEDDKWRKSLAFDIAVSYEKKTLPLYRAACKAWYNGLDQIQAFKKLSSSFDDIFGSDAIRLTISNTYKQAIYWKDNSRRYRVTKKEKASGKLRCPRCSGENMKPRTYRQGKKLIQCRDCGFSISQKDLVWD